MTVYQQNDGQKTSHMNFLDMPISMQQQKMQIGQAICSKQKTARSAI